MLHAELLQMNRIKLGPKAEAIFDMLDATQKKRASAWLIEWAEYTSPQRIVDVLRWYALGAREVRVVDSLMEYRGAATADARNAIDAVVLIRPSKGGKWGRGVEYRVIP